MLDRVGERVLSYNVIHVVALVISAAPVIVTLFKVPVSVAELPNLSENSEVWFGDNGSSRRFCKYEDTDNGYRSGSG